MTEATPAPEVETQAVARRRPSRRRATSRPAYRLVASSGVSNDASPATRTPVKVAVTGAAGQIGYSLLFRLANGDLLGKDAPIELRLLEIAPALKTLEGVVMELDDCAFPTLAKVEIGDDPRNLRRRQPRPARRRPPARPRHGAGRPARGERRHLRPAGHGAQRRGGGRRADLGHRQPREHQRAHRHVQRPGHPERAVRRPDPARPQPGDLAAGREGRRTRHATSAG